MHYSLWTPGWKETSGIKFNTFHYLDFKAILTQCIGSWICERVTGFKIYNHQDLSSTVPGPQKVLFKILALLKEWYSANHLLTLSFFLIVMKPKLFHKVKINLSNIKLLKLSPSDFWDFLMVCSIYLGILSSFSSLFKLLRSYLCSLLLLTAALREETLLSHVVFYHFISLLVCKDQAVSFNEVFFFFLILR